MLLSPPFHLLPMESCQVDIIPISQISELEAQKLKATQLICRLEFRTKPGSGLPWQSKIP